MSKKIGDDSHDGPPREGRRAAGTVKFSVPRDTYRKVEAVRNWERRSESSELVLSGRPPILR